MTLTHRPIAALLALSLMAGCAGISQSRLNPMNWFAPRERAVESFSIEKAADPRPLIEQITAVAVEPLPSGALVRATGLAATQGYWMADLVVGEVDETGTLVIDFVAIPAAQVAAVSTPRSREITAAVSLRSDTLAAAKRITVRGQGNQKTAQKGR